MLTYEELLALWNDPATRAEMTREQLDELATYLREDAEATVAEGVTSQEQLDHLAEVRDAMAEVRTVTEAADAEQARLQAEADALLAEVVGGDADGGDGGEAAAEGAEGAEGGEGAAEGGTEGGEAEGAEATAEGADAEAEDRELVAASAAGAGDGRPRGQVTRVAARRPEQHQPAAQGDSGFSLVASANIESASGRVRAGSDLSDPRDLARAFEVAWNASRGYRGPGGKVNVAHVGDANPANLYGEARTLGRDPHRNTELIRAVQTPEAITAAGGRCVPSPVRYDLPTIVGTTRRPVRDQLTTRFGADRGGVVTIAPATIDDVDTGGVGVWTDANDQDPDDPATKPCLTMTCPDTDETVVDAITMCLEVSNFRGRFFPEQVQEWQDLLSVWQARFAERRMITAIGDASTQVDAAQVLGASRSLLAVMDQSVAGLRDRHRLDDGLSLTLGAPRWLRSVLRTDIARQLPVGTTDETLAIADAAIERWFTMRGVNPVWLLDGETGQEMSTAQADGDLNAYPADVVMYLFPTGSWIGLDGGTLDLGMFRDSALTEVNKFRVFAESWEQVHFHGVESWRITTPVCPSGTVAATEDITDLCPTS